MGLGGWEKENFVHREVHDILYEKEKHRVFKKIKARKKERKMQRMDKRASNLIGGLKHNLHIPCRKR